MKNTTGEASRKTAERGDTKAKVLSKGRCSVVGQPFVAVAPGNEDRLVDVCWTLNGLGTDGLLLQGAGHRPHRSLVSLST